MRSWLAASIVLFTTLPACGGPEKQACEHARERMVATWRRASTEAIDSTPPGAAQAKLRADAEAEIDRARSRFVDLCVALPEPARACIARIDLLITAQDQMRAAQASCKLDDTGMPDAACLDAARALGKSAGTDCDAPLAAFSEQLFAP